MIEAWAVEHRPWLYFFLRRFELVRFALTEKAFRKDAFWSARLRCIFHTLCGHETEICQRCGGKVNIVWWCADIHIWSKVTGCDGNGVLCANCFDGLANDKNIFVRFRAESLIIEREHNTDSDNCWCLPKIDVEHGVIVHNALDNREFDEIAAQIEKRNEKL